LVTHVSSVPGYRVILAVAAAFQCTYGVFFFGIQPSHVATDSSFAKLPLIPVKF